MTKAQVIAKIETGWSDFNAAWDGLSPDQMLQPGVMDEWSVKDLIAHVSWWEEESLNHLPEMILGIPQKRYSTLYGGIDAFNALMTQKWRQFALDEVQQKAVVTHAALMAYLDSVAEEQFLSKRSFLNRLRWDTFGHYPIHAQAIRDWRNKSG